MRAALTTYDACRTRKSRLNAWRRYIHVWGDVEVMTYRRDSVTVPRIWVTFALSVLLHALIMWRVQPQIHTPSTDEKTLRDGSSQLSVQLTPRRTAQPAPQAPPVVRPPRQRMAEAPPRVPPPKPA